MGMTLTRRAALGAGAGLLLSFHVPALGEEAGDAKELPGSLKPFPMLDAWIRVDPRGRITVFTGKAELGQGIRTALTQIASDRLSVPAARINLVTADTGQTPNEGYTAGSHSMQDSGTAIFHAAGQVRALLLDAAAARLAVPVETLSVRDGVVHAADGRTVEYGPLAAALSLHVSAHPAPGPLTEPGGFRLIGTSMPRVDIPAKFTGGAAFIHDMTLPGLLHARVVRQPSPGAKLTGGDFGPVERMAGLVKIVRRGDFLAVVADNEWRAVKAWRALSAAAVWHETAVLPDLATIDQTIRALPGRDIEILTWKNDAGAPVKRLKARYSKPYLSHGSIGPSCALARMEEDGVLTVWSHAQGMFPLRNAISELLRLAPDNVRLIHVEGSGCYGHNGADDAAADAALIAQAMPGHAIRVQWMREQEHTAEPFGPAMVVEVTGALDAGGKVVDWTFDVWSNTHSTRPVKGGSLLQNAALPAPLPVPPPAPIPMPEGGGERNSNPLYAFPNAHVVSHFLPDMPIRVSAQRGLGAFQNIFAIESFMDELAEAAGADPVAFRLAHLRDPRARDVIQTAADQFGWTRYTPSRPGAGRGFAFARYKNLGAYCAIALELAVEHETGQIHLGRIVAAVDSGQPVNPDGIRNQIEGGILQSASWTLYEQVAFDRRHIVSADWSGYPIMRFPAVPPSVDVHIIERPGQPFLGTGEASQGPTAAAIANAVKSAAGARLRDLPLRAPKVKAAIGV